MQEEEEWVDSREEGQEMLFATPAVKRGISGETLFAQPHQGIRETREGREGGIRWAFPSVPVA